MSMIYQQDKEGDMPELLEAKYLSTLQELLKSNRNLGEGE